MEGRSGVEAVPQREERVLVATENVQPLAVGVVVRPEEVDEGVVEGEGSGKARNESAVRADGSELVPVISLAVRSSELNEDLPLFVVAHVDDGNRLSSLKQRSA